MQKRNMWLAIFSVVLSVFYIGSAVAEYYVDPNPLSSKEALTSSNSAKSETRITVATDEWPPFRIATKSKTFEGFDIDLLQSISEITDLTFDVKRYPWARALKQLKQHKVDMMTGLAYTDKRASYINYIPFPYFVCKPAFYMQRSLHKDILSYKDLYQYKIGYVLNSAYFEPFNSDSKIRRDPVSTETQLLKMAQKGRLDVFIGTDCQVDYEITRQGLWGKLVKATYQPEKSVELYLGVAKQKNPTLAMKLSRALTELDKSGKLEQIKNKYFASYEVQHETNP
ncbi:substrate-binding periplasmic protein [Psychromonas sp. Urea-02u-13]|uniref:substrate-binding periplasmic protein n=1 Tax=Psychromonas sp. Urea-02u-13 TaxID=2058326 RepID=UPI000C34AFCE|nr:transporter substrate-binding domain-containing protein [Psychromonas sp. Urea-02u-13]PKG38442.1 ABC transporter substrate-binding protein [Psychromonas sp. Urea-02u-13]